MFYCEQCRIKNEWPEAYNVSHGKCECCGAVDRCHDRPSSTLPPVRRASSSAAVTVDALPEATTVMQLADEFGSGSTAYTAAQVREIVRAAVEADRARQQDMSVRLAGAPADAATIKGTDSNVQKLHIPGCETLDEKAENALLWCYRRLKNSYGRLPFVEEAVAGLRERTAAAGAARQGGDGAPEAVDVSADRAQQGEPVAVQVFTCKGKGGEYELVGYSNGAGPKRGETIIVYRDTRTPDMFYHRSADDFRERMEWLGARAATKAAAPDAPKDHEIREAINQLRDVAVKFHATQQLRSRIADIVLPLFKGRAPVSSTPTAEAVEKACWSCKQGYTAEQRLDADGNCPHCGVEIEEAAAPTHPSEAKAGEQQQ